MDWLPVDEPDDRARGPDTLAARKPGFRLADMILVLDGLLLALIFVPQAVLGIQVMAFGAEPPRGPQHGWELWLTAVLLLVFMAVLPFLWVLGTRQRPWQGTIAYFRLHDPLRGNLWGIGIGLGLVALLVLFGLLLQWLGNAPENPAIADLQRIMTWPLAIALSLAAAFGEEILFRGVLQKHITVWGQAAVFGLLHAYQGLYGIALTFLLALLFGFIVKKGGSLWMAIAAHFTFDFVQMAALLLAPEVA